MKYKAYPQLQQLQILIIKKDRLLNIESQLSAYLRAYVCGTFTFEQAPDSKNENK